MTDTDDKAKSASGGRFDIVALGEPMIEFNETAPGVYRQGFGGDTSNGCAASAPSS